MFNNPLARLTYYDGINVLRCKCCQRTRDDHRPDCPIRRAADYIDAGRYDDALDVLLDESWRGGPGQQTAASDNIAGF